MSENMVKVIATREELNFRIQKKQCQSKTAIKVKLDHNVRSHINDKSIVIVVDKKVVIKKKESN